MGLYGTVHPQSMTELVQPVFRNKLSILNSLMVNGNGMMMTTVKVITMMMTTKLLMMMMTEFLMINATQDTFSTRTHTILSATLSAVNC